MRLHEVYISDIKKTSV